MAQYLDRITHCTFTCKDYAAMKKFYGETLGMKELFTIDYTQDIIDGFMESGYDCSGIHVGEEWLSYFKVTEKEFIELFSVPYQGKNDTENTGFHHVCFLTDDIVGAARDLEAKGVELFDGPRYEGKRYTKPYEPHPAQCGCYTFFIQDPEGNEIEIMQYTENSLQTKA